MYRARKTLTLVLVTLAACFKADDWQDEIADNTSTETASSSEGSESSEATESSEIGCGDGLIALDEACDGVNLGTASCESLGYDGGTLACTESCTLDESGCTNDSAASEEAPQPDSDTDGIADPDDNCFDIANPNQLDFDGDGAGNVCDDITYATVSGMLSSGLYVDGGPILGNCMLPIIFMLDGGQVLVRLDDEAEVVGIELTQLDIADFAAEDCNLLVNINLSFLDFSMINAGGAFPVSFPHNMAAHDAGEATGVTNVPHPVIAAGTLEASINYDPPTQSNLDLPDANLPPMTVEVTDSGSTMTLTWANGAFVIGTTSVDITMPFVATVDMEIVGLDGTLTLAP